jgi:hypothetical protein
MGFGSLNNTTQRSSRNSEVAERRMTTNINGPQDPLKSTVGNDFRISGFDDFARSNTLCSRRVEPRIRSYGSRSITDRRRVIHFATSRFRTFHNITPPIPWSVELENLRRMMDQRSSTPQRTTTEICFGIPGFGSSEMCTNTSL